MEWVFDLVSKVRRGSRPSSSTAIKTVKYLPKSWMGKPQRQRTSVHRRGHQGAQPQPCLHGSGRATQSDLGCERWVTIAAPLGRSQQASRRPATVNSWRHATKPMEATSSTRCASTAPSNGFHSGARP
jgi:hypothetical protein